MECTLYLLIIILQLQVLAWTVADHTVTIATHSQHKRIVSPCQIYPTDYNYQGQSAQSSLQNCRPGEEGSIEYMNCSTPSTLTDDQHGPELYNNTNQDNYYHIIQGQTQILFTFPQVEIVRDIVLYYYSDSTRDKNLPRVLVHMVNNDFSVGNDPRKSRIAEVGPRVAPSESAGLQQEIIQVNASSKKWLLRFDELELEHQFYLSEVSFFSCTLPTLQPSSHEGKTTTESYQAQTTVTLAPATAAPATATPTQNTTNDVTTLSDSAVSISANRTSTGSLLPWILMGAVTVLFLALLMGNVICCIVCIAKHYYKKRQYKLKRNPSYLPTQRAVDARNFGFENHIYDVPTT